MKGFCDRVGRQSSVQSLNRIRLFATPWTAAHQASLSITNSRNLLKLMSIESVMPSNHLILCCPFLLLPSIFPSIRSFSSESVGIRWPKYWSFSFSISPSMGVAPPEAPPPHQSAQVSEESPRGRRRRATCGTRTSTTCLS